MRSTRIFWLSTTALIVVLGGSLYWAAAGRAHPYWIWLAVLSVITFGWYGFDKAQAKRQGLRGPEWLLHSLALVGGFPGAFLGRALFRHKTQKIAFTLVLWVSAALHAALIWWGGDFSP